MKTMQLPGVADYDSHMEMHTSTVNIVISLAREYQKYISEPTWAHDLLDHGKDRKIASKHKCTKREYHTQDIKYVPHTSVKMSCATTQLP